MVKIISALNFYQDAIFHSIPSHSHPGRPYRISVTLLASIKFSKESHAHPGKPRLHDSTGPNQSPKINKKHPQYRGLQHLWIVVKSCLGASKILPRPNLLLHSISSTSREAMPYIGDLKGPGEGPKIAKTTFRIRFIVKMAYLDHFYKIFPTEIFEIMLEAYTQGLGSPLV